jgi:hypothetical protein
MSSFLIGLVWFRVAIATRLADLGKPHAHNRCRLWRVVCSLVFFDELFDSGERISPKESTLCEGRPSNPAGVFSGGPDGDAFVGSDLHGSRFMVHGAWNMRHACRFNGQGTTHSHPENRMRCADALFTQS